jgi:hypothetical protein
MNDCGIACAAMLCQSTYKQADWAFKGWDKDRGLTTREMIDGMRDLGPAYPTEKRLVPWTYEAAVYLIRVNRVALLKAVDTIPGVPSRTKHFHWCVFDPDRGYVLDPLGEISDSWQITKNWFKVTHYIAFR